MNWKLEIDRRPDPAAEMTARATPPYPIIIGTILMLPEHPVPERIWNNILADLGGHDIEVDPRNGRLYSTTSIGLKVGEIDEPPGEYTTACRTGRILRATICTSPSLVPTPVGLVIASMEPPF